MIPTFKHRSYLTLLTCLVCVLPPTITYSQPPSTQPPTSQPPSTQPPTSQPTETPRPAKPKPIVLPPAITEPRTQKTPPNAGGKATSPTVPSAHTSDIGTATGSTKIYEDEDYVVTGSRLKRRVKNAAVKTELIRAERIEAKGAISLIDALRYEPGIRIDNQCSICNTTAVKLAGLPGRYTQILVDGLPVFTSLGMTYGLLMMDALGIKQVEIVKGSNSVLYGTDAIGGIVNVITKTPVKGGEASAFFEGGDFDYRRLGGYAGFAKGPLALGLMGSYNQHGKIDRDGDGISEYAGLTSVSVLATLRYHVNEHTQIQMQTTAQLENRQGGALGSLTEVLDDFDRGLGTGRRAFSETIISQRYGATATLRYRKGRLAPTSSLSGVSHKQDSDYEGEVYVGNQLVVFAQQQAHIQIFENLGLLAGVAYRYEKLTENVALSQYTYQIPGVYVQADWAPTRWLEVLPGLRYDYHNAFGSVVTPRLALKSTPLSFLTLRTVVGTGFRAPTTFYEYAHGVRPQGYKLLMQADKPERSIGVNGSATLDFGSNLNVTVEGAYNRISNPITVEVVSAAGGGANVGDVRVINADGNLGIASFELQVQSSPLRWLGISFGYGFYDYDNADVLVSAAPKHQLVFGLTLNLRSLGSKINISGKAFSPMNLKEVYGEGFNLRTDRRSLDGWLNPQNADINRPKRERSPTYAVVNLRFDQSLAPLVKALGTDVGKEFTLYIGIDNIFDYHQADHESPLYFPTGNNGQPTAADVIYIWGPMRGRFLYAGAKAKF
ncbi:MAG: TonB-dependent receptor [Deltaproteobacteria bacterium]|nr:TonB-dependent receptor [Deltaproteobacteria bacterium]